MAALFSCLLFIVTCGCDLVSPPKLIPATIDGASMAPFLLSDHLNVDCADCGYSFACEVTDKKELVCPNCGFAKISSDTTAQEPTEQVNLRSIAGSPKRWDVVGFELPDRNTFGVKRVVGLPGETVEIVGGDIFVDGFMLRKPIDVQRNMRIPVFDSHSSAKPPFDLAARFTNDGELDSEESNWNLAKGEIQFLVLNAAKAPTKTDWLAYQHWRCFVHQGQRDQVFPIEDSYGYNQSVARDLTEVDDLFVEYEIEFENQPIDFRWSFRREKVVYVFSLFWEGDRWRVDVSDNMIKTGAARPKPLAYVKQFAPLDPAKLKIEFSSFDGKLIVALDETVCLEQLETSLPLPPTVDAPDDLSGNEKAENAVEPVLRFGATSSDETLESKLTVKRLQIWRDVYYLNRPIGTSLPEPSKSIGSITAGTTGVILLGDNSPRSLDSRSWESPAMEVEKVIGVLDSRDTPR
jgi:signal peptidase I